MASLNVQAQIRHNAETVQDYFKDLQKWRSTVQKSEACGGRTEIRVKSSPESGLLAARPSHSLAAVPASSQKDEEFQQPKNRCKHAAGDNSVSPDNNSDLVLARDKNSIASYYAAWDRFNIDAELAKLDNEDSKPRTTTRKRDNNEVLHAQATTASRTLIPASRAPGKGTMRTVIKSRESKEAAGANIGTADTRSLLNMHQKPKLEGVDNVVQNLHSQLLSALATNQASLLDYNCSRYRSAVKGFTACLSCVEESTHFKAPSPSRSVRPSPSLISHWRKLRSIFQTNLGFSHLCVARTNRGAECADSAQLDWPESPFVHLLRAAYNKMEGDYVQAGRHLREVLAQLTSEEPLPLTRGASGRYQADAPESTTGHLLAASIAALDTHDFDFLSSTIALTRVKAESAIPAVAFPRAETQSRNRRRQPRENPPGAILSQRVSVSESHHGAGSTHAPQDHDLRNTFGSSSPSSATRADDSTDRERAEVPDFEANGTHETKTEGLSFPFPRVDLRETVSGELLEILALRQKEAVALRHRRRRQVWQLNEQRLQELDRGSLGNQRFPETNPTDHGDLSAMSRNSKTEEESLKCAATSHCRNSESMSVDGNRRNGTAGFALRSTTRRLHVHILGDYWYSMHARYEGPQKQLLRSREEVEGCRQNRNDLTFGQGCHARPDLHAEKTHEACSRHSECLSVASTEANDGQSCGESISLSHCMEAEAEAGGTLSVMDKRSDLFQAIPADAATAGESVIPLLPQIKAMPEMFHPACTLPGSQRSDGYTTTLRLPPSTYLSFRQRWYAACSHDVVSECRAKVGTATATDSSGLGATQQRNKKTFTQKPPLQCLPCLQNKLTLLGTLAEHQLFSRVFKSSLEPEILADVLEVVAEGLRYTVICTDGKDPIQSGCPRKATRTSTLAEGGDAGLDDAPLPQQTSESRGPLVSGISMPETTNWLGLTCVHNILVQLSEVPRFWSVVYQFDRDELCVLQHVLRSCLQHREISARKPKDDSTSTSSGVRVLQPRHRPLVPSEDSHADCNLTDRLREIQAKLPDVEQ